VMLIDEDYQYALVGSGSDDYLWILSRTPQISGEIKDQLLAEAQRRGYDTETAIRCGVVQGLVSEIAGAYMEVKKEFKDIKLVMTGGDADFLKPLIEKRGVGCVVNHDLVGLGMISIYNYNRT
ncbi:MAG: lipocalin family protein, partial [Muribaculaceae bacterium]|nr:lipocalin family protein [Muribaculaceae bacterium]